MLRAHRIQQHPVLKHEQVRVKNSAFLRAHAVADHALHFEDLLAGQDPSALSSRLTSSGTSALPSVHV